MFKYTLILFISFFYLSTSVQAYTCDEIRRDEDEVDMSCLDDASDEAVYKAQMMMVKLIEQVTKIEKQIGKRQSVFVLARAGSSLTGFDHLRSYDDNDQPISLDEIYKYGIKQLPNKKADRQHFENYFAFENEKGIIKRSYDTALNKARSKISDKYLDKNKPKLTFSHAGILYRTREGAWNILHELMPCSEKRKAYLFQESTTVLGSPFFLDKPNKYTTMLLPLKDNLQKRIIEIIATQGQYMALGPVYSAMSNPWDANTSNSNSFVLEMLTLADMPMQKYNNLRSEYDSGLAKYNNYINRRAAEIGELTVKKDGTVSKTLTVKQRKRIRKKESGFYKVCRPDFEIRKEIINSYTEKGYQSTKVVFDTSLRGISFKDFLQQQKVTLIGEFFVGDYLKPNKKFYKYHTELGVGESISVHSIWEYMYRQRMLHEKVSSDLYVTPTLNYKDALRFDPVIRSSIQEGAKYRLKEDGESLHSPSEQLALVQNQLAKYQKVLDKMRKKGK